MLSSFENLFLNVEMTRKNRFREFSCRHGACPTIILVSLNILLNSMTATDMHILRKDRIKVINDNEKKKLSVFLLKQVFSVALGSELTEELGQFRINETNFFSTQSNRLRQSVS